MKLRSGSRCKPSGLGTQMNTASARARSPASLVTVRCDSMAERRRISVTSTVSESPEARLDTTRSDVSNPTTSSPASAIVTASGRPTYPSPMTAQVIGADLNRSTIALSDISAESSSQVDPRQLEPCGNCTCSGARMAMQLGTRSNGRPARDSTEVSGVAPQPEER
jgi:hypothetical protein